MIEDVIDQVYEEGIEKGKLDMAKKLLKLGFTLEKLAEITELPVEELKKALTE